MRLNKIVLFISLPMLVSSCGYIEKRADMVNNYEQAAYRLSKENRGLKEELGKVKYKKAKLESKVSYLEFELNKFKNQKSVNRTISSVPKHKMSKFSMPVASKDDLVKFDTYKWKADDMLSMAQAELKKHNYEKAAQFYHSMSMHYPKHEMINDEFYFQAAMASYESKKHLDWSEHYLSDLLSRYPNSKHFRGAKLWLGLTYLKSGKHDKFFQIVEEFRKKYRNTSEWTIISKHYEKIVQDYKE